MASVGLAISCYFATISLIETILSLCPETSQRDGGKSKGLCSGIPAATCDQTQFSKKVSKFKLGFRLVGLDEFFVFVYSVLLSPFCFSLGS